METKRVEDLLSYESNFDTRKVLNRAIEAKIPLDLIKEIEYSGVTIEQIEAIDLPVYKYATQVTIHGDFSKIKNLYVNGYKYLILNKNGSLGVKYNAIDGEKKKIIKQALRYSKTNKWSVQENSQDYYIFSPNYFFNTKEEGEELFLKLKKIRETIPDIFIGKSGIRRSVSFGINMLFLYIDLNAIAQKHLWPFISYLTDGEIGTIKELEKIKNDLAEEERKKQELITQERERRSSILENYRKNFTESSGLNKFKKLNSIPRSTFLMAVVAVSYVKNKESETVAGKIRIYLAETGKYGRLKGKFKDYDSLSDFTLEDISSEVSIDIDKANILKLISKGLAWDLSELLKIESPKATEAVSKIVPVKGNLEAEISRNLAKNGIEVKFNKFPSDADRDFVKSKGFKWSSFSKVWYATYSDKLLKEMQEYFKGSRAETPKPELNKALALKIAIAKAKIAIALAVK